MTEVKESTQNSNRRISQEEERTGKRKDKHVCLFVYFKNPNHLRKKIQNLKRNLKSQSVSELIYTLWEFQNTNRNVMKESLIKEVTLKKFKEQMLGNFRKSDKCYLINA